MAASEGLKRKLNDYGTWAIVTGASSGIGRSLALSLAEHGMNLILVGRNKETLDSVEDLASTKYGVGTQSIIADLADRDHINKVINKTESLNIGLLVASAGFGTSGEFLKTDIEDELNMMKVNCDSLLILSHHFSQLFAERKRGGIVLLSSTLAFQGTPYAANYAATKAYVQTLGEALYVELKGKGVDVLAAAPGPVGTGFADRADMQMGNAMKPENIALPILKALGRKSTVLPGFLTKFLMTSLSMLPRWGKVRVMSLVMGGFTKHQRDPVD